MNDGGYAYQHYRQFPYYKVQWYDPVSLCWRDVQKAHASVVDARAAFVADKQCRVMEIREDGRAPLAN